MGSLHIIYLDTLTAITLHNSLFKFGITNIKKEHQPFPMKLHPMAYMLMLCDELQCWDRKSYGQNSRQQLHPMGCDLKFDGENQFTAVYLYDKRYEPKKKYLKGTYQKMVAAPAEDSEFLADIKSIMQIDQDSIDLKIDTQFVENDRTREIYLSESNFVHLYHFSIVLHYRNHYDSSKIGDEKFLQEAEASFDQLPIEYKMSGISRTKNYDKYLNAIGYFYSDRNLDYELIGEEGFSDGTGDNPVDEVSIIGEMEHERWNDEKLEMGWNYDTKYKEAERRKDGASEQKVRELTRTHYEINVKYDDLGNRDEEEKIKEQRKDTEPLKKMIDMMEEYDGLRIYKIPGWKNE